ncbi:helix-turn-helix domain-containing protein [Streptomyces apocyni]|uniref:helix-turn-helix domain-containing protein n=1 Tax=Streptomyces apocyni TaxID=2654677 RepID=UPI0012EA2FBC|nr:helix-turn-helix domain-containing protein [Streptomyces apocyni]
MRINRSARTRCFTVLGNEVLRDRRLSFTARGLLAYMLSLPDGAREDVRTLADKNPGLGRRGIAKALDELIEYGYYVRRTARDQDSGQVRTETHVFDTPHTAAGAAPLPASAGTGEAGSGKTGASPQEEKNPEKEPTHPAPVPEATGRGAALLARLGRAEPKLTLSAADALALAPLATPWLRAGVSELEARALLTAGLPPVVHSARALLANRLVRKLPAPRTQRDSAAPAAPPAECAECRAPLPGGQQTGICAACAVRAGASAPPASQAAPAVDAVAERVAALRAVLRARPTAAMGQA